MINELPTAFPWSHKDVTCTGMTLRDYFAAKAMHAYITANYNILIFQEGKYDEPSHCWTDEELSEQSYQTADAMIKARGQE